MFRYPVGEFESAAEGDGREWSVRIGASRFWADGFELSLDSAAAAAGDGENQASSNTD